MAKFYTEKKEYEEDVTKLKLYKNEKIRAKRLINKINNGKINEPQDFLENWKKLDFKPPENGEEIQRFVKIQNIKGASISDRLSTKRLKKKLKTLLNDDWIISKEFRAPHLIKKSGKETYCVGIDGHHRIMAFKAVGIDEIWARYEVEE